jgi:hypothetical protein
VGIWGAVIIVIVQKVRAHCISMMHRLAYANVPSCNTARVIKDFLSGAGAFCNIKTESSETKHETTALSQKKEGTL